MRRGELIFRCSVHGYECRAWNLTVCAKPGRVLGCESCAVAFARALDAIGFNPHPGDWFLRDLRATL